MSLIYDQKDIVLQVEGVNVTYGDKAILNDISFVEKDVVRPGKSQGQIIAFVGRSGRGKSTLFRILTGLEQPTSGRVLIPDYSKQPTDGRQPARMVREGDVGFVNQRYTLFRNKTIIQALRFAYRKSPLSSSEKEEKIMQYLAEWGLEKAKDQYPNELSGGQRQRTAILEQLLSSGYYMVLDEPFSGLDVGNIESVKKAFHLINNSNDLNTILFSTHDIELAVELADSIYIIGYADRTNDGASKGGSILKHFDLKQMGLAWCEKFNSDHIDCVREIKDLMLTA
jgi:ABC-type multidrug transport system ATPase subunit